MIKSLIFTLACTVFAIPYAAFADEAKPGESKPGAENKKAAAEQKNAERRRSSN